MFRASRCCRGGGGSRAKGRVRGKRAGRAKGRKHQLLLARRREQDCVALSLYSAAQAAAGKPLPMGAQQTRPPRH